jgi:MacB-like periplasmic core domain
MLQGPPSRQAQRERRYRECYAVASGRGFSREESDGAGEVVILGRTVAEALFGGAEPIGETVRVQMTPLRVVGVLDLYRCRLKPLSAAAKLPSVRDCWSTDLLSTRHSSLAAEPDESVIPPPPGGGGRSITIAPLEARGEVG